MLTQLLLCLPALFAAFGLTAQANLSKRLPEIKIKAGERVPILVTLPEKAKVVVEVSLNYTLTNQAPGTVVIGGGFQCSGVGAAGTSNVELSCVTNGSPQSAAMAYQAATVAGIYSSNGEISVSSPVGLNRARFHRDDLPLIQVLQADPSPTAELPTGISGVMLYPDRKQTLEAAAQDAKQLLNELTAAFPVEISDTQQSRDYLLGVARRGKGILATASERFVRRGSPIPSFLVDCDVRFDQVIAELQSRNVSTNYMPQSLVPRFVAAQYERPHTSTQVPAIEKPGLLNEAAKRLTVILLDIGTGWLKIALANTEKFTFTIVSTPQHAKIYVSSPSHPESELGGETDLSPTQLDYGLWTFRLLLNGCSEKQTHDPYLQDPIPMKFDMSKCARR